MKEDRDELRRLIAQPCDFVLAASEASHLESLPVQAPEVAFWGRSNVGKSSLINALMRRKALARTSTTPGRTQQIIFFNLADQLLIADLPGYGHAKAPKTDIEKWNALIRNYLRTRSRLRCVFLLLDGRHGVKANDQEMMSFLDQMAVSYQVVLTKADQMRGMDHEGRVAEVEALLRKHPAARPTVLLTSSEKDQGLDAIRQLMLETIKQG
ncbi:MAG: YihA family ribosome biogenesis GTP-binding protein [Proteobacteria bacterium]|jgi:GTP-binding protein|nr:ribosome biogenesis GTP-binding protein YihA/YsxC [Alphaproteobacteria bacterium]NCC03869.1 YihA family ribosome biogenesis GTP-binding protein [Pseudomonadota bacterium]